MHVPVAIGQHRGAVEHQRILPAHGIEIGRPRPPLPVSCTRVASKASRCACLSRSNGEAFGTSTSCAPARRCPPAARRTTGPRRSRGRSGCHPARTRRPRRPGRPRSSDARRTPRSWAARACGSARCARHRAARWPRCRPPRPPPRANPPPPRCRAPPARCVRSRARTRPGRRDAAAGLPADSRHRQFREQHHVGVVQVARLRDQLDDARRVRLDRHRRESRTGPGRSARVWT
jgi:hypothetical protein